MSVEQSISSDRVAALYPELELLGLMATGGWRFNNVIDQAGEILYIVGNLARGGYVDALLLYSHDYAVGCRRHRGDGGAMWFQEGRPLEVITDLLALPEPDSPLAPRTATGTLVDPGKQW